MLRPRVIVPSVSLLATAIATPLTAQRLEVAARLGYSPPTGTLFQLNDGETRSWEGGAVSVGVLASYWPLTHLGIQGTVDLRLARAYTTYPTFPALGLFRGPVTFDTSTTQLAASLRVAARQVIAQDLVLTASLGPAMIRFGHAEYGATLSPYFVRQIAYGVAGGLSATCIFSSRINLTLSAEDVVYQLQQKAVALPLNPPSGLGVSSVDAPLWHEFTFSAAVSVRVL